VGNRSSHATQRQTPKILPDKLEPIVELPTGELTTEELELHNSMDDDIEIEKIKEQEIKEIKSKKK
jgi:hypothetical protein